jgi:hypothetical protein
MITALRDTDHAALLGYATAYTSPNALILRALLPPKLPTLPPYTTVERCFEGGIMALAK